MAVNNCMQTYAHMARIPFSSDWVDTMLDLELWLESCGIGHYRYWNNNIAFEHERDLVLFHLRFS